MEFKTIRVLGIDFFSGSLEEAVTAANNGGLCVAPSGPGLAHDLTNCPFYYQALTQAELVLPDSGLMCLWAKSFLTSPIKRISGLAFLEAYLRDKGDSLEHSFWVMPDENQSAVNRSWIEKNLDFCVPQKDIYVAPQYAQSGTIQDSELLARLEGEKPKSIFIQIGGGVQERLGLYLRENLSFCPTILCTGAALAFLSGNQVSIPSWADRFYLGWLVRCLREPRVFIPRYAKAFRLIGVLLQNGKKTPDVVDLQTKV